MEGTLNRWWIYQQERFHLFKNGLLIAVFSLSAVCHSILLRKRSIDPVRLNQAGSLWRMEGFSLAQVIGSAIIAFLVLFLFFLQLRIADEFKDFEEDARYRPDRPVPRGLISLNELGIVGIAAGVVQLGLTLALDWQLVGLLLLVWFYLGLMTKEFFVSRWLKAHPIAYLLSHSVIMPLMAMYATACDWLKVGAARPQGLFWFLAMSYCVGLAIEIGRKIRAPKDEERGVETYTALWGIQKAVIAWLSVIWLLTLTTLLAALYIQFPLPVALLLLLLLTASVFVAWQFKVRPITQWAKRFEVLSALWTLGAFFGVGILPLILIGFG